MEKVNYEITKEDWEKYVQMENKKHASWEDEFVDKYVPMSVQCGYGVYGVKLNFSKQVIEVKIGGSCD